MKRFVRAFFLIVILIIVAAYAYFRFFTPQGSEAIHFENLKQFYPEVPFEANEYIAHAAYHLSYNETHEQPNWVVYLLTSGRLEGRQVERKDHYKMDEAVPTESASMADYRNSGYDRGHLAPAADMRFKEEVMLESFFMSNISPQKPAFNRGGWRKLENLVRNWALDEDSLIIVTGPVLTDPAGQIGANEVTVPRAFYKVVLDLTGPERKTIAFLMPNKAIDNSLREYAMSVDELEAALDYNFFARLPDKAIDPLEKVLNTANWSFPAE